MFSNENEQITFYGMNLWNTFDDIISNNSLNFEYYSFNKDEKLSSPRFKISINGRTARSAIQLGVCELYRFNYQFEKHLMKRLKDLMTKAKEDQSFTEGYVFNSYKKNVYVTLMWNSLANAPVVRFMIGEKEKTILDSDKVYVTIIDLLSFHEILKQAYSTYMMLCMNSNIENRLTNIETFLKEHENLMVSNTPVPQLSTNQLLNNISESVLPTINDIDIPSSSNQSDKKEEAEPEQETQIVTAESENQNNFDDFLKKNRDSFDLDLPVDSEEVVEKKDNHVTSELDKVESKFISKVCLNDLCVLEGLVTNSINEILPLDSFVNIVKSTIDIDFKSGISEKDYLSLNYIVSRNIKTHINDLIEKKKKLPCSIRPIIVESKDRTPEKIDTMYYLFLFYIYLSKVKTILSEKSKNSIDNKEFFSYILKAITNPLVFSYFPDIPEDVIKTQVINRYRILKENKFFDNFFESVKSKINHNGLVVSEAEIENDITKIYNSVVAHKDKLGIKDNFNPEIMKLSYSDIVNSKFTLESLTKVIHFDWNVFKYGKINLEAIDLKSYDDVPVNILSKYGIKSLKFDNTILLRYFKENFKDLSDMEKIERINKNVYDVLTDIDLQTYDDNQLKALYFWDTELLPKDMNYYGFKKLIEKSSLSKSELISMILDNRRTIDPEFYNSFIVAADDE